MSYTGDPTNSATDRMRLLIGDTDVNSEALTDAVYSYALTSSNDNETTAAIICLKYIVAQYGKCVTEKVGGIFIKESEKFEQYKTLLDILVRDPTTSIYQVGAGFAGGISWDDYEANLAKTDNRQVEYYESGSDRDEVFTADTFRSE